MGNKVWENLIAKVMNEVKNQYAEICLSFEFGAYIEPQDYFVSYVFKTDAQLEIAGKAGVLQAINDYHRKCLSEHKYPLQGIKDCTFASQEECDREFNGNWYYFYK